MFDPTDEAALATAIERLLSDRDEAARVGARGLERAHLFTWERTARLTLDSYRRALAG
jgi:glycosyltransferase involved in cell wall biosynthesis